jgi:acetylornithine deacetylase/succinyl-diaminopimelate desuccinylase-like protein
MIITPNPAQLLQTLIRFDTTNPPGNEAACIGYLDELLREAGLATTILAKDPARPNLIARLPGNGNAPPLLLQGHVDVVSTAGQQWTHPPFAGIEHDGFIWGRGALDMKSGVAMMTSALLHLAQSGTTPNGDILLCVLSDEEAGGTYGARFLVEEHPTQFAGVKHALGEFGGFPTPIGGRTFYLVQVAEKVLCPLRITVRGPGGHGMLPQRGGTMARLGAGAAGARPAPAPDPDHPGAAAHA